MTASGSGAPGRELATDEASRPVFGQRILAVLLIGLVFRLIMAYGIEGLRGSGFESDLNLFRFWAANLAEQGPFGFHDRGFYADYTPGYLYALWLVGVVGSLAGGVGDLIKLPAIITDVVLAFVVYRMVQDLGVTERRATVAAAVVILNPITWFDSVIWGQVDSFGTVFLLLSIRELWRDRPERSAVLAVIAGLIKPQLLILVPIIALVTIRRALWPSGGFGAEPPPTPTGSGWERRTRGPIRILSTGVAGFVTAVAISAPFGLSVVSLSATAPFLDSSLLRLILSTAAQYSYITVNAYNAWALFPVDGLSMANNGGGHWIADSPVPDTVSWAAIGPVPAGAVGAVLLLAVAAIASLAVARRPDRLTILVGMCVLALAFFAVPTRVHERYLFPLFALAAIPFAFSWRWRMAYVLAGAATFLNMYAVLTTLYPNNPSIDDWLGIGRTVTSFGPIAVIAIVHTGVFAWSVAQLRSGAARALEAALEGGRQPDEPVAADEPENLPPATAERPVPGRVGTAVAAMSRSMPSAGAERPGPTRLAPAWYDPPSWTLLGPIAWLRARVGETPIRPDRSAGLAGELRGRLDRLDLWLLIVLVVAAMCLRTFRLAEPARMHFDEVYHARTATEFLQDWRYGISHNIYEWTHPHLAKYAMAAGLVLFAGHDVAAASDLGLPVRDAALEPRRPDPLSATARIGERAWVATGAELAGFDLATRRLVASWPVPGASAVAFDEDGLQLLVGTDGGELLALDVSALDDAAGAAPDEQPVTPEPIATLDGPIRRLATFGEGASVGAFVADDRYAVVDLATGEIVGGGTVEGAADLAAAGSGDAVVATPADVGDPAAVAAELALLLDGDAVGYEAQLARADVDTVTLGGILSSDARTELQAAIDGGRLPGISIGKAPWLALADNAGVHMVTDGGEEAAFVPLDGGAAGVALVTGVDDGTQLYATTIDAESGEPEIAVIALTGDDASTGPEVSTTIRLPGAGSRVLFDEAAELVEVVGAAPGADTAGTTVYVVEPHGKSVFADHDLPFEPSAWILDHAEDYPTANRGEILAFATDGSTASLDVGHYAFAWRLPGAIMGAVTVAVLFLLARILFRRRDVGVLVGLFVLLDGMFFVQSRIAMNDVYTGAFIIAAYALFAWLWIDPGGRPRWAFWALLPVVGLLLGLALASKWVAAYAIGALAILVLVRSALGRLALIVGLLGLTAVLGWMAMAVPAEGGGSGNLAFALLMIGLTMAAVVITVYHPVAWSDDEVRLAVGGPPVLGMLVFLGAVGMGVTDISVPLGPLSVTPFAVAFVLVIAGGVAYTSFRVAGRLGFGPLAPIVPGGSPGTPPAAPPVEGWLRPGSGLGLPILWMLGSMVAIPLAVYVVSYLPWAFVEGHQIVPGWPPGNEGQTLVGLTGEMYRYHNNLTAAHAASSPWWAWPLNLKPVWFYQGSFANDTAAAIYDAGNLVIWWLGIPAVAFVGYQAFRRRSLALALIVVAFLAQWVSWARIDRAAFQYHYYTALPFVVLALGYFVAELWHGASRRTWLLARVAAAVAVMGPAILWLLRGPMCALANVAAVNEDSQACTGNPGNLVVTPAALALVVAGLITVAVLVRLLVDLSRPRGDGRPRGPSDFLPLALATAAGVVAIVLTRFLPAEEPLFRLAGIVPELIALAVIVLLGLVALLVVSARDARRFATAIVLVVGSWFVLLYPNVAALPLPSTLVNAYQGILPTYLYAFQFAVNTVDRSGATSFSDARFVLLTVFLAVACVVVAYSAWTWRVASGDRVAEEDEGGAGPAGAPGSA